MKVRNHVHKTGKSILKYRLAVNFVVSVILQPTYYAHHKWYAHVSAAERIESSEEKETGTV